MINESLVSGAVVHACNTNRFAMLLCDLVRQSKAETAKPGYTPTVKQFCRNGSIEDATKRIAVEGGTDFCAYHGLPILSGMIRGLSRDADLTPRELDYTGTVEGSVAVVADDLLHVQIDGLPYLTDSFS